MKAHRLFQFCICLLVLCLTNCGQGIKELSVEPRKAGLVTAKSPLETYVKAPDDAFEYRLVDEVKGEGYTTHIIRMTSQKWLSKTEVKDPIWWHWMTMVVPDGATSNKGMLFIGGGSRNSKQPKDADQLTLQIALSTQSVVTYLHNVPNQPTVFKNDSYGPRVEDELIAYGWRQFLEGGAKDEDRFWLARFPMTKAAVRAMDVIAEVSQKHTAHQIDQFVVTGASKRGWTTWTTAAVDDRVIAIAPIVIDMLNVIPSFQHHWKVYGKWAAAVGNYQQEGIMEWQDSKEYNRLVELTEPFSFREQLTMPKLLLNATGDQFFIPDSWQFYWKDLLGEKHLRYVPNSEHSMRETDAPETLIAFYNAILNDSERPTFDWSVKEGKIQIQTKENFQPSKLTLWQAHNPNARNFQVDEIGRAYEESNIPISADGKYEISVSEPEAGFTAFFVELTFEVGAPVPLKLTTGVVVTPDKYPFGAYQSPEPKGTKR